MTLTKNILIELIQKQAGFSAKEAQEALEIILEEIKRTLEDGEVVKISGFGKWSVKDKKSRPGRNPHTGEKIQISSRRVVTFQASEKLRKVLNYKD